MKYYDESYTILLLLLYYIIWYGHDGDGRFVVHDKMEFRFRLN